MSVKRILLVTASEVGVIVEVGEGDCAHEIATARQFLHRISRARPALPAPSPISGQQPASSPKTLAGRILALGSDYFSEPRESAEICKELARAAHHYRDVRVRVELGRLVRRGALRRIGDGTKSHPYKYVNP